MLYQHRQYFENIELFCWLEQISFYLFLCLKNEEKNQNGQKNTYLQLMLKKRNSQL